MFLKVEKSQIKIKTKKGHVLYWFHSSKDSVKPNPKKVETIGELPLPKATRGVNGLIDAASYYRRFILNFSKIAEPWINLKQYMPGTQKCQEAFDLVKESLNIVPILAFPDVDTCYRVHRCITAASGNVLHRNRVQLDINRSTSWDPSWIKGK